MRVTATALAAVLTLATGAAGAQQVMREIYHLEGVEVRVMTQPFLTDEELTTLRLVGQSRDALALFVTDAPGYSAMAVAPDEGFVRAGAPVGSAMALSGLESAEAARTAALAACNRARSGGASCVIVLEVAPL